MKVFFFLGGGEGRMMERCGEMDASHLWARQVQEIVGERLDSLLLKLYSVYLYIHIFDSDAPHQQSTTTAPMFLKDELAEL